MNKSVLFLVYITIFCSVFSYGQDTLFWVGDGGNWNDSANWASTSGGVGGVSIPVSTTTVYFDLNSFSAGGFEVYVDSNANFASMDWTGSAGAQVLKLDSSMYSSGNVTFTSNVTVVRDTISAAIQFEERAEVVAGGAFIDCNFIMFLTNDTDSLILMDNLIMSDSSGIILINGRFLTQGNDIVTGSMISIDKAGATDSRTVNISNSNIHLIQRFDSSLDPSLSFNATGSDLYIGDTIQYFPDTVSYYNSLKTQNLAFNNVTLNFQALVGDQDLSGDNTFNKFKVIAGSRISIEAGSTQTVTDSLILQGSCKDSIELYSSTSGSAITFTKTGTDVIAQCLILSDIDISSAQTAFYSDSVQGNTNWTFSTQTPVSADFNILGPYCFGDTVIFENNSTPASGITYLWNYNDGSASPFSTDSIVAYTDSSVLYVQQLGYDTTAFAPLNDWVEIIDMGSLFDNVNGTLTTTSGAELMNFQFDMIYSFDLINTTGADAYLVDMDNSATQASYKYRPKVKVFKNGVELPGGSPNNAFLQYSFYEDTLASGTTSFGGDTTAFSITVQNLTPTDQLTIQAGVVVTYESDVLRPRWKDGTLTSDNDVLVNYRLNVDSIHFVAVPASNFYQDTLQHEFASQGDSIQVVLIAMNPLNQCTDTLIKPITVSSPSALLTSNEYDNTICAGTEVNFYGSSTNSGAQFQFYVNDTIAQIFSADTSFTTSALQDGDTINLVTLAGGCTSVELAELVFTVHPAPVSTWTSSDADTIICDSDTVFFNASPDSLNTYQYLLNGVSVSGYTLLGEYYNASLINNDTISLVTKTPMNCRDTVEMIFTVNALPVTTLAESTGGNVICAGQNVTFTAAGADTYAFYVDGLLAQAQSATDTYTTDSLNTGEVVSVIGYSLSNCSFEAPTTYSYIVNPLPNTGLTSSDSDTTICAGTNVDFNATGASSYEFFVNGVSVQGPAGTSIYSTTTLTQDDTVYVVGTLSGCDFNSDTIIFNVNTNPTTTLTSDDPDNTICSGTTVNFTASGATNYSYYLDGTLIQGPGAIATWTSSSLVDGQVILVTGESNGCEVSQQLSFTVIDNPIVGINSSDPDNIICFGDPITFTGSSAISYELLVGGVSIAGPQASPIFANPSLGVGNNDVTIQGTAGTGCSGTSSLITVTVNALPTINLTSTIPNDTICDGESVTFTGSGGDMYQFAINGTPQGSMSVTNTLTTTSLTDGAVIVVYGSLLGCLDTSAVITMGVNPLPSVSLTSTDVDNVFCEGDLVTFTGVGADNYEFFVNAVSQGPSSPTDNINSSGFSAGSYNIQVIGETNSCTASSTITATVNPLPTATLTSSAGTNTACSGQTVTYTAGGGNLYQFFINGTPQGAPAATTTFSSASLVNGDVISVTTTSSQGCLGSSAMPAITINPTPSVALSSSVPGLQICIGDNVDFTASGANEYEFFINGTSQGAPSPTNTFSTTGLSSGDEVTATGTSIGCSNTPAGLTFTVFNYPVVSLTNNGDTAICVGENTDLIANGANNFQFVVNGVPVGAFGPTSIFNSPLNNGDVLTVNGETNGCVSASINDFTFVVYNFPNISSSSSDADNIICMNDTVQFTASGAMTYDFLLNGSILQSGVGTTMDISTLADGDVISIIGYNGDCASSQDNYTFTVNSMNLDLQVTPSSMICTGEAVTFTGSGADQYEFFLNGTSTGGMSALNTYSSSSLVDMDQITFTAYSNTTLCTQDLGDYIMMNVIDEPTITPPSPIEFCDGDSVVLYSNMPYGNQWYLDGTPISGASDTFYVAYVGGAYSLESTAGGNGDIWSFGYNADGTFGDGSNFNNGNPTPDVSGVQFDEISAGSNYVLGVATNGDLYSWGDNSSGQLGDGTYTAKNTPTFLAGVTGVKTVATGDMSSMAVTTSGDVFVWGNNALGQLGTGNTSVVNFPFQNASLTGTDTIAGGKHHFVLLKSDGTVWCVGDNSYGQLGQGNLSGSMIAIQVPGLTNVVSVGAGEYNSFAIDANNDLYVWGNNGSGQLGLGDLNNRLNPTVSSVKDVVNAQGGANHSAFLTSDNKVYVSGGNDYGQLGQGNYTSTMVPIQMGVSGANMISTGQYTTLVKRVDNSVYGCGNNTEEQLSSVTGTTVSTPEHITDLDGVGFIEAGKLTSHVLYNISQSCVSQDVNVNVLNAPVVSITSSADTLSTTAGVSYQWYLNGNPIPGSNVQNYVATVSGNYYVEVTFASGCIGTSEVIFHGMSGMNDLTDIEITLYPNPTRNDVYILVNNYADQIVEITIIDALGRIVSAESKAVENILHVDTRSLQSGNYQVIVKMGDFSSVQKLIKL